MKWKRFFSETLYKAQSPAGGWEPSAAVRPLSEMVEALCGLTPQVWMAYAWSREPLAGKFTWEQKLAYGRKAVQCARQEAEKAESRCPKELAKTWGIKLLTPEVPAGNSHVLFAQYREPDEITVYMDCVRRAKALIKEWRLEAFLGNTEVFDVLLAHELFHVVEYRKWDSIYTRTEKVELWRKPFSNRSTIICLGEIAGMEYAARLTGLKTSPYVFDVVLMYGYNKEGAAALYEEIMALKEHIPSAQTNEKERESDAYNKD